MDQPTEPRVRGPGRRRRRREKDPDIAAAMERLLLRVGRDAHTLRDRAGWSQEAEAQAAGIHQETVQTIEKGIGDPRLSTLVRLFYVHGYELQIGLRPTNQHQ